MYLINNEGNRNKQPFLIREKLQMALKQSGFIEEIDLEDNAIEITGSTQGKRHLLRIFITDLVLPITKRLKIATLVYLRIFPMPIPRQIEWSALALKQFDQIITYFEYENTFPKNSEFSCC